MHKSYVHEICTGQNATKQLLKLLQGQMTLYSVLIVLYYYIYIFIKISNFMFVEHEQAF